MRFLGLDISRSRKRSSGFRGAQQGKREDRKSGKENRLLEARLSEKYHIQKKGFWERVVSVFRPNVVIKD